LLDRAAAGLGIAGGIDTEPRSPAALSRPAR
jgi:hypothetical protein